MSIKRQRRKARNEQRIRDRFKGKAYIPYEHTISDEEIAWRMYELNIKEKIGTLCTCFDGPEPRYDKHKRLSKYKFSSNYDTSEEFSNDRNKITSEYLAMHKEVPDDLLNKVAETVAELNITYLDIF